MYERKEQKQSAYCFVSMHSLQSLQLKSGGLINAFTHEIIILIHLKFSRIFIIYISF